MNRKVRVSHEVLSSRTARPPTQYLDLVADALSDITQPYFMLATTYEPSGIVRERVFCYELYHKMRLKLGNDSRLSLNGEIDKRGHVDFEPGDQKNPDFVFHIPGTHEGNTIAMEVKGRIDRPANIVADFRTLLTFCKKYSYQAGLFALYNHTLNELARAIRRGLPLLASQPFAARIHIMAIQRAGDKPERTTLAELATRGAQPDRAA